MSINTRSTEAAQVHFRVIAPRATPVPTLHRLALDIVVPVQADRAGDVSPQRDLERWPVEGHARRRRAPAHPDRAASQLAVRDRAIAARQTRRYADSRHLNPARGMFYAN